MDKGQKIKFITDELQKQIIYLLSRKTSGKIELTVEIHATQGGIGDVFLQTKPVSRERVIFNEIK